MKMRFGASGFAPDQTRKRVSLIRREKGTDPADLHKGSGPLPTLGINRVALLGAHPRKFADMIGEKCQDNRCYFGEAFFSIQTSINLFQTTSKKLLVEKRKMCLCIAPGFDQRLPHRVQFRAESSLLVPKIPQAAVGGIGDPLLAPPPLAQISHLAFPFRDGSGEFGAFVRDPGTRPDKRFPGLVNVCANLRQRRVHRGGFFAGQCQA